MKNLTVLVFLFQVSLFASESPEKYNCEANRFFKTSIVVKTNFKDKLSLRSRSKSDYCSLQFDSIAQKFLPDNSGHECSMRNWSRPSTDRDIVFVSINKNFALEKRGYLLISLDNSMAEYGPDDLKSFIYCRRN